MPQSTEITRWDRFKGYAFHIFPHHWVSYLSYYLTRLEIVPLKNFLIRTYIRVFKVDLQEAEASSAESYRTFNHFFTRSLQADARPLCDAPNTLISPCDGTIAQIGNIEEGLLLQAKGNYYKISELLGGLHPRAQENAQKFTSGKFCSFYLSPRDYHRVHAPTEVTLETMTHIPGRLFSVAHYAVKVIPQLYVRNERVVSIFKSDLGYIAIAMVGALNVGSIETSWSGLVTPTRFATTYNDYSGNTSVANIELKRGDELGRFNIGSAVILLIANSKLSWNPACVPDKKIHMGEELGCLIERSAPTENTAEPSSEPINAE